MKAYFLFITTLGVLLGLLSAPSAQGSISEDMPRPTSSFALQYAYTKMPQYGVTPSDSLSYLASGVRLFYDRILLSDYGQLSLGASLALYGRKNIFLPQTSKANGSETYASLIGVPVELLLSYSFLYFRNQWVVPFVRIGGNYTWLKQSSKTGANTYPSAQHAPGITYAVGVDLLLDVLEPSSAQSLFNHFGITDIYLTLEYLSSKPKLSQDGANLSYQTWTGGLRLCF